MKKIIIIGSGFGGLALAIRLQSRGFNVIILEKNAHVGGHAYPLEKAGYHFDMGPSLTTAPDILQDLFSCQNRNLFEEVEMVKLNPFYRIFYHDKTFLDYSDDREKMKSQLHAFYPGDADRYDRFLKDSEKIYNVVIAQGMGKQPFMTISSMLKFFPKAIQLNALRSTYGFAKKYFKDEKSRFAFSFHPLFIGGNPFRAPAVYEMIPYLEKEGGVWYSKGGMYSLIEALERLFIDAGGEIHTNEPAKNIVVRKGKTVGVQTEKAFYDSDAVVSNADFIHSYRDLIDPKQRRKWSNRRLNRLHYSMSAFMLYLGVKKKFPQLLHHTLILSPRYKQLITDIFDRHVLPDDFSMYLHMPSKTDPSMAPSGCSSLYILVPVTHLKADVDWTQKAGPYADRILHFLEHDFGLQGLQENLEVKEIFTPLDFAGKNNSTYGSAWGVEPRLTQTAYLRPHNKSEDIENFYLVGASTHPGAGLPGCLLTAETTESVMIKDLA
jgi:phytoene desaturase